MVNEWRSQAGAARLQALTISTGREQGTNESAISLRNKHETTRIRATSTSRGAFTRARLPAARGSAGSEGSSELPHLFLPRWRKPVTVLPATELFARQGRVRAGRKALSPLRSRQAERGEPKPLLGTRLFPASPARCSASRKHRDQDTGVPRRRSLSLLNAPKWRSPWPRRPGRRSYRSR
jgi:hypothetical protein